MLTDGELIEPDHLPPNISNGGPVCYQSKPHSGLVQKIPDKKNELLEALEKTGGNKSQTARLLGVTRMTVLNRMRKYGLDTQTVITS